MTDRSPAPEAVEALREALERWRKSPAPSPLEAPERALAAAVEEALAALSAPRVEAWQPIATAPKDGTEVLIAGGTYWYDGSYDGTSDPFEGVTTAYYRTGEWCGGYGSEYDSEYWHAPTHWMPLPAPPETKDDE